MIYTITQNQVNVTFELDETVIVKDFDTYTLCNWNNQHIGQPITEIDEKTCNDLRRRGVDYVARYKTRL